MKYRKKRDTSAPEQSNPQPAGAGKEKKNKLLWTFASLLIAAASIWAVTAQGKDFSFRTFVSYISQANTLWLCVAVVCMLGFIVFEACALHSICGAFGHPCRLKRSCVYSAADIYFSAITPSATGGQPASAFLMMKDGIPGAVTTVALLLNLAMYSLALLIIGLVCFLFWPGVFLHFGTASKVLIVIGYVAQVGLSLFFILLIKSERLLQRLCSGVLRLLGKLHLLRREAELQDKLCAAMDTYRQHSAMLSGQGRLLVRVLLFNFLQRASQISVTLFVFLAMGGGGQYAGGVWAMQSFAVLGSNCVPIPGAMGIVDYLMLDGFRAFLPGQQAVNVELLSRSLSFYSCILICGITVLLHYWAYKRRS